MKLKLWPSSKIMGRSLLAFIISFALSLLSMGFLGLALYYLAAAPLALLFPNTPTGLDNWQGDWFWPAIILMPMVWSFGFLIAGAVGLYLKQLDWTTLTLKMSYIVILLLWNVLIWLVLFLNLTPKIS